MHEGLSLRIECIGNLLLNFCICQKNANNNSGEYIGRSSINGVSIDVQLVIAIYKH